MEDPNMAQEPGEYAQAGVNYADIEPFKRAMVEVGKTTLTFPNRRGVYVESDAHGCVYEYQGGLPHVWSNTQEGLGNKNWIAEWMYQFAGDGRTYYEDIGVDAALMAVNDLVAQGAMPVVYTDEVATGDSEWFKNEERARALAAGFYRICKQVGMALPAGESPSLRYLIKAEPPVQSAPSLSGCVTGIIAPRTRRINAANLCVGDVIIGIPSTGLHANGISLVIKRALTLKEQFLTPLSTGRTLGEEALIPTRSYVSLVEGLLEAGVEVHALLPGTGSGISKVAFDKRPLTYRIHTWVDVPPLFRFMLELGVKLGDCLTTFNWGIGYYVYVPEREVDRVLEISKDGVVVGRVEEGDRKIIFEPEGMTLPPPGD